MAYRGIIFTFAADNSGFSASLVYCRPDRGVPSVLVRKAWVLGTRAAVEACRTSFWKSYWDSTDDGKAAGDTAGRYFTVLTRVQRT